MPRAAERSKMDEFEEHYRADLQKELQEHDPPRPPWVRYPDIPRFSIGWRMGAGEEYGCVLRLWKEGRSRDELLDYLRRFAPIPVSWGTWAAGFVEGADNVNSGISLLLENGILNDAAWQAHLSKTWDSE